MDGSDAAVIAVFPANCNAVPNLETILSIVLIQYIRSSKVPELDPEPIFFYDVGHHEIARPTNFTRWNPGRLTSAKLTDYESCVQYPLAVAVASSLNSSIHKTHGIACLHPHSPYSFSTLTAFSPITPAASFEPSPNALRTASAFVPTLSHSPSSSLPSGGKNG